MCLKAKKARDFFLRKILVFENHASLKAIKKGGSTLGDLLQALEDYLLVLLGLVRDGSPLQHKLQFKWIKQEDESEEMAMYSAWYDVLFVLHLMATLSLSEANFLLLPRTSNDGYLPKVSEESRRSTIDILLKAARYLDCAVRHTLPLGVLVKSRRSAIDIRFDPGNLSKLQEPSLIEKEFGLPGVERLESHLAMTKSRKLYIP